MRPKPINLFLTVLCLLITLAVNAQTCSGSLGDPVINQNFGAGPNPGQSLPSGVTTMNYVANDCPNDGSYTIINAENLNSDCHLNWHVLTSDHTGNPNGYMMVINADVNPDVFFVQQAKGLCPGTTYQFAAWILNLDNPVDIPGPTASNPGVILPDITFTIETTAGQVLKTYQTGKIPTTVGATWVQYGTFFTTPTDVTDVVVKISNNAPGGYGNDLVMDDITFRACGPIVQTGFGDLSSTADQNVCQGGSANFTLKASVGSGYVNPFLQWQLNFNNAGWTNIPGQTATDYNVAITNAQTGTYQYRLTVGEGENINTPSCNVSSLPLTINVNPLPAVSVSPPQTICEGQALTLTATGGTTYLWSGPNMAPSNQNPLVINSVTAAAGGTYTLTATSDKGCAAQPVQTTVTVVPKVTASVSPDATICAGSSVQLKASGGLYYQWTPSTGLDHDDIANPVATPAQTTTYSVKVSNNSCFDDSKSVTVTVNADPTANAGAPTAIFEGQSVKLNGTVSGDNITNFYWDPTTYLDNPNSLTPTATPPNDITYTLYVLSKTCGQAHSSVFVRVYKQITIPNTFTPNGDGVNDIWNIEALVTYPESLTTVYTRDGQQVFKSTGYAKPWDGTYNGKQVPAGTYYYVIDLKNGQPKLAGWVLVLR